MKKDIKSKLHPHNKRGYKLKNKQKLKAPPYLLYMYMKSKS
jgi:hypothetical protein